VSQATGNSHTRVEMYVSAEWARCWRGLWLLLPEGWLLLLLLLCGGRCGSLGRNGAV
jgi:hypothetical protein